MDQKRNPYNELPFNAKRWKAAQTFEGRKIRAKGLFLLAAIREISCGRKKALFYFFRALLRAALQRVDFDVARHM